MTNYSKEQNEVLDHLRKGVSLLEQVIANGRLVVPEREHKLLDLATLHVEQASVMVARALAHAIPPASSGDAPHKPPTAP
jgi:hypothetical protein